MATDPETISAREVSLVSEESGQVSPTRPPGRPPATGRRLVIVLVAITVVLVVVIASVFVFVLPSLTTHPSSSIPSSTDVAPLSMAENYSKSVSGGPWSLVFASGQSWALGTSLQAAEFSNPACTPLGDDFTSLQVPGYNGSYSTGHAEVWAFTFNSTGPKPGVLELLVYDGKVYDLGTTTGPGCVGAWPISVPSTVIDSGAAAQAAFSVDPLASFRANISTANVSYELVAATINDAPAVPTWVIVAVGCGQFGLQWYQSEGVNALTGSPDLGPLGFGFSQPSVECPTGGPPIGTSLTLGDAILATCPSNATWQADGCNGGDDIYDVPVVSSSIVLGDFLIGVENSTGGWAMISGTGGFSILNSSGHLVSLGEDTDELTPTSMSSGLGVPAGANAPLAPGDVLRVDMGTTVPSGPGFSLWVYGTATLGGKIDVGLPPVST